MTVKELMDILAGKPADAQVYVETDEDEVGVRKVRDVREYSSGVHIRDFIH